MAYQIQYGKPSQKERFATIQNSKKWKIVKWTILCSVVLALVIFARMGMLDFLIPGDEEVTTNAFQTMIDNVKDGESVKNAVTAFCEEILTSANIED